MNDSLAIFVNSDKHPDYVIRLARAARAKGKSVIVHFLGQGVLLADPDRLAALGDVAEVSVCRDSFEEFGVPGALAPAMLRPVSRTAELVDTCARHVVF